MALNTHMVFVLTLLILCIGCCGMYIYKLVTFFLSREIKFFLSFSVYMEQLVSALQGEAEQWESTIWKMTYRPWSVLLHLKSIPFSKRFVPLPKRFVLSPKRSVSFRTSWFIYSNQTDFFAIPWVTRLELVLDTYRAIFASQGWRYASLLRSVSSSLASEDALGPDLRKRQ